MKKLLMASLMVAASAAAHAEAPRVRAYANVGYGMGGEALVSGRYTDGSGFELLAGNGWVMAVGADLRISDSISIQASAGQQRNRINAANADFDFQRYPIELLGFYALSEQVRLGLGARKVYNAKLTGTDAGYGWAGTGNYDSNVGAVLEAQYLFSPPSLTERKLVTGVNLRFVKENFTLAAESGGTGVAKRGDHVALGLVFYY